MIIIVDILVFFAANQAYVLTFYAKSSISSTVTGIYLMQAGSPWANYASFSTNDNVVLGPDWTKYTVTYLARCSLVLFVCK